MFTKLFLFCLAVTFIKVTANPLLQALSNQNCQICPQNAPRNQYSSLPLILQYPDSNIQSYPQVFIGQDGLPYQQVFNPAQNQMSCPVCKPQCAQNQNNQINANLFDKILSSPSLRNILDPNTRLFNQNGAEIPRNMPCNNVVPNIVNNYIIVPPEFLLEDAKCNVQEDRNREERKKNRNNQVGGRRRQKTASDKDGKIRVTTPGGIDSKGIREREETTTPVIKSSETENCRTGQERKSRRRNRNKSPEIKVNVVNKNVTNSTKSNQIESPLTNLDENVKDSPEKVAKNLVMTTGLNNFEEEVTATTKSSLNNIRIDKEPAPVKSKVVEQLSEDQNVIFDQNSEPEQNTLNKPIEAHISITKDTTEKPKSQNSQRKNGDKSRRPKTQIDANIKNAREEAAIQDFCQKFPNIPEEVVRNLLDYMKKQLEKQQLGVPAFYYPQFPINYNQLYKSKITDPSPKSTQNKSKNSRRRNNRRRRKKKPKQSNLNTDKENFKTVELSPMVLDTEDLTTIPTTTEKLPITETTKLSKMVVATVTVTEDNAFETTTAKMDERKDKEQESVRDDYSSKTLPELGSEDVVPIVHMNSLVDDYYPDFTDDNQYYNDEDYYYVNNFQEDWYHYTTDKNLEFEELNRERRKMDSNHHIPGGRFKHPENKYHFRFVRPRKRLLSRPRITSTTEKPSVIVTIDNKDITRPRIIEVTTLKSKPETKDFETITDTIKQDLKPEKFEENELQFRTPPTLELKPKNFIENELQFRTPPTLETIDFETKQINKDAYYFHNNFDYTEKSSSYSDVKTPQYSVKEKGDKKTKNKPKDEVETVYARSKVVTYGRPNSEEAMVNERDTLIERDEDISQYIDNDKTVVLAKTVSGSYW